MQTLRKDMADHLSAMKNGPPSHWWQAIEDVRSIAAPGEPIFAVHGTVKHLWLLTPFHIIAVELTLRGRASYSLLRVDEVDVQVEERPGGRAYVDVFTDGRRAPFATAAGDHAGGARPPNASLHSYDMDAAYIFGLQFRMAKYPEVGEVLGHDDVEPLVEGLTCIPVAVTGLKRVVPEMFVSLNIAKGVLGFADTLGCFEVVTTDGAIRVRLEDRPGDFSVERARATIGASSLRVTRDDRLLAQIQPREGAFLSVKAAGAELLCWLPDHSPDQTHQLVRPVPGVLDVIVGDDQQHGQSATTPADASDHLVTGSLPQLAQMFTDGLLTAEEFATAKSLLLASLPRSERT